MASKNPRSTVMDMAMAREATGVEWGEAKTQSWLCWCPRVDSRHTICLVFCRQLSRLLPFMSFLINFICRCRANYLTSSQPGSHPSLKSWSIFGVSVSLENIARQIRVRLFLTLSFFLVMLRMQLVTNGGSVTDLAVADIAFVTGSTSDAGVV
jgi:hypothetical protein